VFSSDGHVGDGAVVIQMEPQRDLAGAVQRELLAVQFVIPILLVMASTMAASYAPNAVSSHHVDGTNRVPPHAAVL
jgi:hypothetical protein